MHIEVPENLKLSREEVAHLETYAERLLEQGLIWPQLDPDTETVRICAQEMPHDSLLLTLPDVQVHLSNGRLWQTRKYQSYSEPLHELPGGIFAINRLRGRRVAQLDVVYVR